TGSVGTAPGTSQSGWKRQPGAGRGHLTRPLPIRSHTHKSYSLLFDHWPEETQCMHRHKRGTLKIGRVIAGLLLLFALTLWVKTSVDAYQGASSLLTPVVGTVQTTPTDDATVTALNKEKLAQEVQQLKNQNAPDLSDWLRTSEF
ncbi:MAG TPA: hypothetical protein VEI53_00325, partial [Ktedonobacteraceae bacterium]|nr:hypothetical protein [Ktedonobacteraceae bacterium]